MLPAAAVVAGLLALAVSAGSHDSAYVGTSRRVDLKWGYSQCQQLPSFAARQLGEWWPAAKPNGLIETPQRVGDQYDAFHHARGVMRFTSRSTAVFQSDAGGTLAFHRRPANAFRSLGCSIG